MILYGNVSTIMTNISEVIRNRVVEIREIPGNELLPDSRNWRRHPASQRAAMDAVIEETGFAGAVVARQTDDGLVIIDGHLRAEQAGATPIPVAITDLSYEEAGVVLATFDPLSALAVADDKALTELVAELNTDTLDYLIPENWERSVARREDYDDYDDIGESVGSSLVGGVSPYEEEIEEDEEIVPFAKPDGDLSEYRVLSVRVWEADYSDITGMLDFLCRRTGSSHRGEVFAKVVGYE